jgi:hypothetical protein
MRRVIRAGAVVTLDDADRAFDPQGDAFRADLGVRLHPPAYR